MIEFEIVMKDEVYDKLFCLMNNIDNLNDGSEIGAWMLGDWVQEEDKIRLVIDNFIIPKQKVSGAEVDMSPESMIDIIKEIGHEQANRIKAHWHIHPFSSGSTSWSGGDESKIADFMEPTKGRQLFVFMLSSKTELKARVELVAEWSLPMFKKKFIQRKSLDNLEVKRETDITESPYLEELKETIKTKVEKISYVNQGRYGFSCKYEGTNYNKKDDEVNYLVSSNNNYIRVKLDMDFYEYLNNLTDEQLGSLSNPAQEKQKGNHMEWGYFCKKYIETKDKEKEMITDLQVLEAQYEIARESFNTETTPERRLDEFVRNYN